MITGIQWVNRTVVGVRRGTYSYLLSLTGVTPNLSLVINNDTGEVQVLEELDREQIPAYTVIVKVSLLYTRAAIWMC